MTVTDGDRLDETFPPFASSLIRWRPRPFFILWYQAQTERYRSMELREEHAPQDVVNTTGEKPVSVVTSCAIGYSVERGLNDNGTCVSKIEHK